MDELIRQLTEKYGVDPGLVQKLVEYEQTKVHLERRRGARDALRRLIEQHIEEKQQ